MQPGGGGGSGGGGGGPCLAFTGGAIGYMVFRAFVFKIVSFFLGGGGGRKCFEHLTRGNALDTFQTNLSCNIKARIGATQKHVKILKKDHSVPFFLNSEADVRFRSGCTGPGHTSLHRFQYRTPPTPPVSLKSVCITNVYTKTLRYYVRKIAIKVYHVEGMS